jgi:hypothetical protein
MKMNTMENKMDLPYYNLLLHNDWHNNNNSKHNLDSYTHQYSYNIPSLHNKQYQHLHKMYRKTNYMFLSLHNQKKRDTLVPLEL